MAEVTNKRLLDAWYVFFDLQTEVSTKDPKWDRIMDARLLLGDMMREKRKRDQSRFSVECVDCGRRAYGDAAKEYYFTDDGKALLCVECNKIRQKKRAVAALGEGKDHGPMIGSGYR